MKFIIRDIKIQNYDSAVGLQYLFNDYSFCSIKKPSDTKDFVITINELQLELGVDTTIIEVWGFCHFREWKKSNIEVPLYIRGQLSVIIDFNPMPGCGYAVNNNKQRWPVWVNVKSGWICIGDPSIRKYAVEFIDNCIAVIKEYELVALWLKPQTLPPL